MIPIERREHVVCFDVDDTLVMWDYPEGTKYQVIKQYLSADPEDYLVNHVAPHDRHIKYLKTMKERGYCVIVWSAGGARWAQAVVDTLELGNYVDLVISKPGTYFDDKPATSWMGNPVYVPYGKKVAV